MPRNKFRAGNQFKFRLFFFKKLMHTRATIDNNSACYLKYMQRDYIHAERLHTRFNRIHILRI